MEVPLLAGPIEIDLVGERLLDAVTSTCDPDATFSAQVEAGLRGALMFSSAEPECVRALLDHNGSEHVLLDETGWRNTLANRLRAAAKRQRNLVSPPLFLESLLICEVEERLSRWLREGQAQPLGDLVREQSELILGYYAPRARPSA